MQVSIIILNYNTFEFTSKCIQSVIDHTVGLEYEIILVDNASTECDALIFQVMYPKIVLLRSEQNLGFAKGNNFGIRIAKGENILLLNSDTQIQDNAIKLCDSYLRKNKNTGVVTTKLVYPDGQIQSNCQRFPNVFYNLLEILRFQKFFPNWGGKLLLGSFFKYDEETKIDWTWGAFFMFPKAILSELPSNKLFDDFFMYGEDMWWCWQIKKCGYNIYFLPQGKVIHLVGGSSGPKVIQIKKNWNIFIDTHYSKFKTYSIRSIEYLLNK